ncbi:hypothetical protein ACFFX0_11790 [Citricoccus parietis]|uniref:Uncharacterized protein n=1 Tax=Citricoccus parietis TaxID=592307 RepID=A0ABV5FYT8_9MICC
MGAGQHRGSVRILGAGGAVDHGDREVAGQTGQQRGRGALPQGATGHPRAGVVEVVHPEGHQRGDGVEGGRVHGGQFGGQPVRAVRRAVTEPQAERSEGRVQVQCGHRLGTQGGEGRGRQGRHRGLAGAAAQGNHSDAPAGGDGGLDHLGRGGQPVAGPVMAPQTAQRAPATSPQGQRRAARVVALDPGRHGLEAGARIVLGPGQAPAQVRAAGPQRI